jgi:hypothetical protein
MPVPMALPGLVFECVVVGALRGRLVGCGSLVVQVERVADLVPAASGFAGEPEQVRDQGVCGMLNGVRGFDLRDWLWI